MNEPIEQLAGGLDVPEVIEGDQTAATFPELSILITGVSAAVNTVTPEDPDYIDVIADRPECLVAMASDLAMSGRDEEAMQVLRKIPEAGLQEFRILKDFITTLAEIWARQGEVGKVRDLADWVRGNRRQLLMPIVMRIAIAFQRNENLEQALEYVGVAEKLFEDGPGQEVGARAQRRRRRREEQGTDGRGKISELRAAIEAGERIAPHTKLLMADRIQDHIRKKEYNLALQLFQIIDDTFPEDAANVTVVKFFQIKPMSLQETIDNGEGLDVLKSLYHVLKTRKVPGSVKVDGPVYSFAQFTEYMFEEALRCGRERSQRMKEKARSILEIVKDDVEEARVSALEGLLVGVVPEYTPPARVNGGRRIRANPRQGGRPVGQASTVAATQPSTSSTGAVKLRSGVMKRSRR